MTKKIVNAFAICAYSRNDHMFRESPSAGKKEAFNKKVVKLVQ